MLQAFFCPSMLRFTTMKHMQKHLLLIIMMIVGCQLFLAAQIVVKGSHATFLREGDKSFITATITNKTNQPITGQVHLTLINPVNNKPVDGWFQNVFPSQYYSVEASANARIQFPIQAAFGYIQTLHYQLEATVLENKKEVIANSKYIDSFCVYTNRVLMADSLVLKTNKDTILKGAFAPLLQAPESSTHNNLRISMSASTAVDYWKLQIGNKQFTSTGHAVFDTLLGPDFISNELGNYTLQINHSGAKNNIETKITWTHYNKIEKPFKSNGSFRLQKTIRQKIKDKWVILSENAPLHINDTLDVTITIGTPKPFAKILISENTTGGATLLLPKNIAALKYPSLFTKEIVGNGISQQQIHYQYILTNTGVFSTGNTLVNIQTNALNKHSTQLFIPATEFRIEE